MDRASSQDEMKKQAALEALTYVESGIIGVGTGSTVNHFIDGLATIKERIDGAVSSSVASAARLQGHGIPVLDLDAAGTLDLYVDGADESNHRLELIKGGGGALTREKIVAAASRRFICIADESKLVDVLGAFPLPVEVIPMARGYVIEEMVKLGGLPAAARGLRDRQRQHHPGHPRPAHNGAGGVGAAHQQHRRRGHRGSLRPAPGRPADPRHAGRTADGDGPLTLGADRCLRPGDRGLESLRLCRRGLEGLKLHP